MKSNLIGVGKLQTKNKDSNSLAIYQQIETIFRDNYACFIQEVLSELGITFRNRIFTPIKTLWMFIGQALNADCSCRNAVANFITARNQAGESGISYATGGYCSARKRLPLDLVKKLFQKITENITNSNSNEWLWKERQVKLIDGTSVALENTQDIQKKYPSHVNKKRGDLGFPTAKLVAVISLSCGAVLDAAIGPCVGKNTSENVLLNHLLPSFKNKDLLVFDRYFTGFFNLFQFLFLGCDFVSRQNQRRKDYIIVKKLGENDRIVRLKKPYRRAESWWCIPDIYDRAPEYLDIREIVFQIANPGFRVQTIKLVTSLLDHHLYPKLDIADLYRKRWNIEVDLRSIKQSLGMESSQCKTSEMIEKEIWMYLMTYNLIRAVMLTAAQFHEINVRDISFKATAQIYSAIRIARFKNGISNLDFLTIFNSIISHRIGNRPNRHEPRNLIRDRRKYTTLLISRARWKKEFSLN